MTDSNGLRFWMLANEGDWARERTVYDGARRSLRLASERRAPLPAEPEDETEAAARLARVPIARDGAGSRAWWDPAARLVVAAGAGTRPLPIFRPPAGDATDMAVDANGVLHLAAGSGVLLVDLRGRWSPVTLTVEGFDAWRLAAAPNRGVWVLDRDNRRLARVEGTPLPERPLARVNAGTARPCPEEADPPRLVVFDGLAWPDDGGRPVALACSGQGALAVLAWQEAGDALVHLLTWDENGRPFGWKRAGELAGARRPYSIAWADDGCVAVLRVGLPNEALAYDLDMAGAAPESPLPPAGEFYPLRGHDGGPFAHGVLSDLPSRSTEAPHYGVGDLANRSTRALHPLSQPRAALEGTARSARALDSGRAGTAWHRLYVEAQIPAGCGIRIFLAATEDAAPPDDDAPERWHEHGVGLRYASQERERPPRAAWVPAASEVPYHPGFALCKRVRDQAGLFTVLIQRRNRAVRTLRGRYLHVRAVLEGDGRAGPEVWAVRAYAERFSYVENYLPRLYRESRFGPDAEAAGDASPEDFLERMLGNFEGILTPLEDRIAAAALLMDPATAPDENLEWLARWIGVAFDPAYPPERRRALVQAAPRMFRARGTQAGLALALETVTGGAVSGGEIVIVEDWRLRRAFATILGANYGDSDDPLLAGPRASGNSFVGDTLFLGAEAARSDVSRQEFLSVFTQDLPASGAERAAVQAFFDRLALRVTVLVHQSVSPQNLGLIRRVVELETPAHILARVATARRPFLVGIASLVGADTYVGPEPPQQPVTLDATALGDGDRLRRAAGLDPRWEGPAGYAGPLGPEKPQARVIPPPPGSGDEPLALDARPSRAARGRRIASYVWTWVE